MNISPLKDVFNYNFNAVIYLFRKDEGIHGVGFTYVPLNSSKIS